MTTALAALLLLAPELPLGPYARPGVPVILRSDVAEEVTLDGWPYRVAGATPVHPPRVPCAVRGAAGEEIATLRLPPEGLVGIVGDAPPEVGGVRIRLDGLAAADWPALDLFDRVLVAAGEEVAPVLLEWARAGGSVCVVGEAPEVRGLGEVRAVPDLAAAAALPPPALAVPRPGNVRPDVYDLVPEAVGPSPALGTARWLAAAAGLAMALQLGLAALGRLGARRLLLGLLVVAAAGAGIGLLRADRDYAPVARGTIVVDLWRDGVARRRTYDVYAAVGPGATVRPAAGAVPLHYRGARGAWWERPDRACELPEGVLRVFLRQEVVPGDVPEAIPPGPPFPLRGEIPPGWTARALGPRRPPRADPGRVPALLHYFAAAQR